MWCYVMINRQNVFDQQVKNDMRILNITIWEYNIRKIATGQREDYTTGCLLDYPYSKQHYKVIAIGLSKQQALGADEKAMQQISFTWNLEWDEITIFFIIEEAEDTILDFSQSAMRVL